MKIDKLRIQHFQCICDTGEVPLDTNLTTFVGANESGKSAILKALWCFNEGKNFDAVDISTASGIRERLEKGMIRPSEVEVVTLWITPNEDDLSSIGIPTSGTVPTTFRVTKTYDNEYHVHADTPPPERAASAQDRLLDYLLEADRKLKSVYTGRIKRKQSTDYFVWLERYEGEERSENLVLFPEAAPAMWDSLEAGDRIQVSRIAQDPYNRNPRAMNAGHAVDIELFCQPLSQIAAKWKTDRSLNEESVALLEGEINKLPVDHPLRSYANIGLVQEIRQLAQSETPVRVEPLDVPGKLLTLLPEFVYLPALPDVSDSVSLRSLAQQPSTEEEQLLAALADAVGLQVPVVMQTDDPVYRKQVLGEKSVLLSERAREHWLHKDLAFEFDKDGQRLALWVQSEGSIDPPSRRSKGLASYISLFAQFARLAAAKTNIVVLLDDPGVYLHPVAQRELLPLLDSQPFQVVVATHLPFMIDPDHLERVRLVRRTARGTVVEDDWKTAREGLLPVWGSLLANYGGGTWIVVEGIRDKRVYQHLSRRCAAGGRRCLPDVPIVPGGGRQLVHLVRELLERGIDLVVLLDGDREGREIKRVLGEIRNDQLVNVITLGEVVPELTEPRLEDLFTDRQLLQRVLSRTEPDAVDEETLGRFEKIFSAIGESIARRLMPKVTREEESH